MVSKCVTLLNWKWCLFNHYLSQCFVGWIQNYLFASGKTQKKKYLFLIIRLSFIVIFLFIIILINELKLLQLVLQLRVSTRNFQFQTLYASRVCTTVTHSSSTYYVYLTDTVLYGTTCNSLCIIACYAWALYIHCILKLN